MKIWGLAGPITVEITNRLRRKNLLGQWCSEKRRIRLLRGCVPSVERSTLWHEWVHAVMHDASVTLEKPVDERVCEVLATALTGAGVKPPLVK